MNSTGLVKALCKQHQICKLIINVQHYLNVLSLTGEYKTLKSMCPSDLTIYHQLDSTDLCEVFISTEFNGGTLNNKWSGLVWPSYAETAFTCPFM